MNAFPKTDAPPVDELSEPQAAPTAPTRMSLEEFIPEPPPDIPVSQVSGLRTARLASIDGNRCTILSRGSDKPTAAELAPEIERAFAALALRDGNSVLVEHVPGAMPLVVGVLQTRLPRELHLNAETIEVSASRELVLRAGRAAIRLREDGEIEMVGSRISAASRGLFRIVGRILRLN